MKTANFSVGRTDWVSALLAVVSIALFVALIWSVRTDFRGSAYDGTMVVEKQDAFLRMPAFSDEWVVAGFVQKTVERGGMPDFHPLDSTILPAENVLSPLVLLLAEISRTFDLDIVSKYFIFAFGFQLLFILAFFAFLRACKVSVLSSMISIGILLLLPASNIISGIWIMLPSYIGIMFALLAYACFVKRNAVTSYFQGGARWRAWRIMWATLGLLSLLVACVLYPPLLILASAYVLFAAIGRMAFRTVAAFLALMVAVGYLFARTIGVEIYAGNIVPLWHSFTNILIHPRFGVSTAAVWSYMPLAFYVLSLTGLCLWIFSRRAPESSPVTISEAAANAAFGIAPDPRAIPPEADADIPIDKKEKAVISYCVFACASLLVLAYWFDIEFVLSHQRVVFALWILLIAMFGFFLDRLAARIWAAILKRRESRGASALRTRPWIWAGLVVVVIAEAALLMSGAYPSLGQWQGITTREDVLLEKIDARPVMTDMLPDGFEEAIEFAIASAKAQADPRHPRLLAAPHLALAIAATTEMAPVSTVDSIVSVSGPSYADFRSIPDCEGRYRFAKDAQATHLLVHVEEERLTDGCAGFQKMRNLGEHYILFYIFR